MARTRDRGLARWLPAVCVSVIGFRAEWYSRYATGYPRGAISTFVLVPGGWHGGWYFQSLAEALRAHGHLAFAPTLTGVGERQHLLRADVNLDTHIEDVVQLLRMEKLSDVILLGHSYAGMVLSGVIDREPIGSAPQSMLTPMCPRTVNRVSSS